MTIQQLFKHHGEFILVINDREQHEAVNKIAGVNPTVRVPYEAYPFGHRVSIMYSDGRLGTNHATMKYYKIHYDSIPRVPATALFPPLYKRHT